MKDLSDMGQLEAWKAVMGPVIRRVAGVPFHAPLPRTTSVMDGGKVMVHGVRAELLDAADLLRSADVLDDDILEMLSITVSEMDADAPACDIWRQLMAITNRLVRVRCIG